MAGGCRSDRRRLRRFRGSVAARQHGRHARRHAASCAATPARGWPTACGAAPSLVFGDAGDYAASRMVAGTLAIAGACGAHLAYGMRRGTVVCLGPHPRGLVDLRRHRARHSRLLVAAAPPSRDGGGAFADLPRGCARPLRRRHGCRRQGRTAVVRLDTSIRYRHMNLALFDLDHTLIPFDSNSGVDGFLVRVGATDADAAAAQNRAFARDYMAGTFDPHAYHRFTAGLLAPHARDAAGAMARGSSASEMQVRAQRELAGSRELVEASSPRAATSAASSPPPTASSRRCSPTSSASITWWRPKRPPATARRMRCSPARCEGEPCFGACKVEHVQRWLDCDRPPPRGLRADDLLQRFPQRPAAAGVGRRGDRRRSRRGPARAKPTARGWRILELRTASAG